MFSWQMVELRTLFPLTAFKNFPNPKFVQNLSRRLFFRAPILVALYRAMQLRFGYGFESCDANGPRNVKTIYLAKHRPVILPPLPLVGSKELVLKSA